MTKPNDETQKECTTSILKQISSQGCMYSIMISFLFEFWRIRKSLKAVNDVEAAIDFDLFVS